MTIPKKLETLKCGVDIYLSDKDVMSNTGQPYFDVRNTEDVALSKVVYRDSIIIGACAVSGVVGGWYSTFRKMDGHTIWAVNKTPVNTTVLYGCYNFRTGNVEAAPPDVFMDFVKQNNPDCFEWLLWNPSLLNCQYDTPSND